MSGPTGDQVEPLKWADIKLTETAVSADDPWRDDGLGRKEVSERLSRLVRDIRGGNVPSSSLSGTST